ncbi:unnamed protein product [Pieris macdunnoughi]|uniref:Uncharacterized protein n=1 Tax=Pieris macdunnoughi TaxID=345717 RepID=A0A821L247_9NEOP|nr:unnamed protein product [Pieris macdunnoughi]
MGAPQTLKPLDDEFAPCVEVVDETREVQERKLDRRRAQAGGPRRRGLDNDLESERRRPRQIEQGCTKYICAKTSIRTNVWRRNTFTFSIKVRIRQAEWGGNSYSFSPAVLLTLAMT